MQNQLIEGFRLSPEQRRLWRLQRGTTAFHAQSTFLIEGPLDLSLLQASLHQALDRHEILRTTYHSLPGLDIPVQSIQDRPALSLEPVNLSDLDSSQQVEALQALQREQRRLGFDFERGPLVRCALVEFSPERWALILTLPSLVSDSRSLLNIFAEISDGYGRLDRGPAGEEPVQYIDFAEWRNESMEAEEAASGREFWRRQPGSTAGETVLPYERRSVAPATFDWETVEWSCDAALKLKVEEVSAETGTSAAVFLLACWRALLGRLTAEADLTIRTLCDGRKIRNLDSALGLFEKFLPVSSHLQPDFRFTEVLKLIDEAGRTATAEQEFYPDETETESTWPVSFDYQQWRDSYHSRGLR
jgi:Condensation domain